ncbi:Pepco domain-containing protein [Phormidesmis sp. 146-33]
MPEDYLVIVTDEADEASVPVEGQRGWGEEVRKRFLSFREVRLPVSQLEQNMNQFLQLMGRLFKQVDQQIGSESDMKLDEVELSVEISGEGEVKLVAGEKAAGKGAIKLKFTRSNTNR